MAKILIVDDEKGFREVLSVIFLDEGHQVSTAVHGKAAISLLKKESFDLILSDVRMPDMDGIEMLRRAREIDPELGVVMMTAFGTIDTAREAFKLGADDFIQKPFNNDELKVIVNRAIERRTLLQENIAFRKAQRQTGGLDRIIGNSQPMLDLFDRIKLIANERSTVLITGESGTGKELVARAIHDLSDRNEKPFVPVNCGALPDNLLEAELFGFLRGSFTGAERNRTGMFESASSGTIFLDEIGEMSQAMQVKILRVLQEQRIRRIGSSEETPVDTRVIAATNRDLKPMVESGTFRQDLYYRISVIPLRLPSLSERREDIPALAEHFLGGFCKRSGKNAKLGNDSLKVLMNRDWPGNVRELEHTIERAVALSSDGDELRKEYLVEESGPHDKPDHSIPPKGIHLTSYINGIEKQMVEMALAQSQNQTRAAELLQIEVYQLRHLLDKYGLRK